RRVQHAMFGLLGIGSLHGHAERVQAHIRPGLVVGARRGPAEFRLCRFNHPAGPQLLTKPVAGRFGATQHRRGGQVHVREATQHILGSILKRHQRPRQAHQRPCSGTDAVAQSHHGVVGAITQTTTLAIVVGPPDAHFAMDGNHASALPRVKLGNVVTFVTRHATAYVPLFFRLAKLACRTSLTKFNPASRNSYSIAPNSSCSGTSTARSTIFRTASSTLGRSCCMSSSMRCSRVGAAELWLPDRDIASTPCQQDTVQVAVSPVAYASTCRIPTQVPAAHPHSICTAFFPEPLRHTIGAGVWRTLVECAQGPRRVAMP